MQELLAKLAKVDGYEDTDFGETLTVDSQVTTVDRVVEGESAKDQAASAGGKCNRHDITVDSGDINSSHPEMASKLTQPLPQVSIIQVSLYSNIYMRQTAINSTMLTEIYICDSIILHAD